MKRTIIILGVFALTLAVVTMVTFKRTASGEQLQAQSGNNEAGSALSVGIAESVIKTLNNTEDDKYIVANVEPYAYPQITVEVNKPAYVNFKVAEESLNFCNNEIIIPDLDISKKLYPGDNFFEFTPTETGTINYYCWMGMIVGNIVVIDEGEGDVGVQPVESATAQYGGSEFSGMNGGCCSR